MKIIRKLQLAYYKKMQPEKYARMIGVKMGKGCRLIRVSFSSEPYLIKMGDHVSATATRFETHDGGVWVIRDRHAQLDIVKPITIGSNVFIGYGCIIMPGVEIGSNVVIGAGSIVTRSIPDNSVAVGSPARVIGTIESYAERCLEKGDNTKKMSFESKRDYYIRKYR